VLPNESGGIVTDGIRVIEIVIARWYLRIITGQRARVIETPGPVNSSEEAVVPALTRPIVLRALRSSVFCNVPLTGHVRAVTGLFEHLGDGDFIRI